MNFLRGCRSSFRNTIMNNNNNNTSSSSNNNSTNMGNSSSHSSSLSNTTDDLYSSSTYTRRAHHAGKWYSSDSTYLNDELTKYLMDAENDDSNDSDSSDNYNGSTLAGSIPNACISPHAGFRYSGPTAAYSYLALKEALQTNRSLRTVVVLHPSHHVYLDGCAISGASSIETPLGNLKVDTSLREQLLSTNKFSVMEQDVDEEEHSGEMQYPYIAKIVNDVIIERQQQEQKRNSGDEGQQSSSCSSNTISGIKILPIMIGAVNGGKEDMFGRLLLPYLSDRGVFTVISSDFCHWGSRFSYMPQPYKSSDKAINEIHEYIEWLDRKGMDLIELQRPGAFADYLREYSNTICGRHPISVWLHSLKGSALAHEVRFVKYAQSEKARSTRDSSVSYAGAVSRVAMFDG